MFDILGHDDEIQSHIHFYACPRITFVSLSFRLNFFRIKFFSRKLKIQNVSDS